VPQIIYNTRIILSKGEDFKNICLLLFTLSFGEGRVRLPVQPLLKGEDF